MPREIVEIGDREIPRYGKAVAVPYLPISYLVSRLFIALLLLLGHPSLSMANNWPGVDESVVEKYAKEHGREAKPPLINTDQGDLLLFVFLLAGTIGGFVAGYNWRRLMENRPRDKKCKVDVSACPHAETIKGSNE